MPNEWITHVKKYQAEHGISYAEALKKAGATYKKQSGKGDFAEELVKAVPNAFSNQVKLMKQDMKEKNEWAKKNKKASFGEKFSYGMKKGLMQPVISSQQTAHDLTKPFSSLIGQEVVKPALKGKGKASIGFKNGKLVVTSSK